MNLLPLPRGEMGDVQGAADPGWVVAGDLPVRVGVGDGAGGPVHVDDGPPAIGRVTVLWLLPQNAIRVARLLSGGSCAFTGEELRAEPSCGAARPSVRAAPRELPASTRTIVALSSRLRLMRRFASAMSGCNANGRREPQTVITLLWLAPEAAVKGRRSGSFRKHSPRPGSTLLTVDKSYRGGLPSCWPHDPPSEEGRQRRMVEGEFAMPPGRMPPPSRWGLRPSGPEAHEELEQVSNAR